MKKAGEEEEFRGAVAHAEVGRMDIVGKGLGEAKRRVLG